MLALSPLFLFNSSKVYLLVAQINESHRILLAPFVILVHVSHKNPAKDVL